MSIDYDTLKQKVLETAKACIERGGGYSQQKSVLDEVVRGFGGNMHTMPDVDLQKAILTCWHDLFREGVLSWGLDIDNPGPPFFHIPERSRPQELRRP